MEPTIQPKAIAEWMATGEQLSKEHKTHQWRIADWLVAGMDSLPPSEVYDTAERLFPQYARRTFIEWVRVARAFPIHTRMDSLTFGHHQAVLRDETGLMPHEDRVDLAGRHWLAQAADGKWTVAQLRNHIAHDLDVRLAAKDAAESESAESETEQPAAPAPRRSKSQPAFTLATLQPERRYQLEKLATARRVPTHILAQALIEEGLDAAIEEINAHDERVSEIANAAAAPEREERARKNAEYCQRRADELAAKFGGNPDDYLAAAQEYGARRRANFEGRQWSDETGPFCAASNPWQYANWRVNRMWDEAHRDNASYSRQSAECERARLTEEVAA